MDAIKGGAHRSVIDCTNVYYQIQIKPDHRKFTMFAVKGMGLFEFIWLPFGLSTAPGTVQRNMDMIIQVMKQVLRQLELPVHWINYIHLYMDD